MVLIISHYYSQSVLYILPNRAISSLFFLAIFRFLIRGQFQVRSACTALFQKRDFAQFNPVVHNALSRSFWTHRIFTTESMPSVSKCLKPLALFVCSDDDISSTSKRPFERRYVVWFCFVVLKCLRLKMLPHLFAVNTKKISLILLFRRRRRGGDFTKLRR